MSADLPTATHSGTVTIMGVDLVVHRLDSGQTVIEPEGVHRLFEAMANGADLTPEDAMKFAKVVRQA